MAEVVGLAGVSWSQRLHSFRGQEEGTWWWWWWWEEVEMGRGGH